MRYAARIFTVIVVAAVLFVLYDTGAIVTSRTVPMQLVSSAFAQNGNIPARYNCKGKNVNPPLAVGNLPKATTRLALIVDDPDAPAGTFTHWMAWDIPVQSRIDVDAALKNATIGKNSAGEQRYTGPCPKDGMHRYFFRLFALDSPLNLPAESDRPTVEAAIHSHSIAQATLIGTAAP